MVIKYTKVVKLVGGGSTLSSLYLIVNQEPV